MKPDYNVGDLITWESQSGGVSKSKTGQIVSICVAGEIPVAVHQGFPIDRGSSLWRSRPTVSKNDRYVVSVPRGSKSGKVWFYTPSVAIVDGKKQKRSC